MKTRTFLILVLVSSATFVAQQPSGMGRQVRSLNNQLQEVFARLNALPASQVAAAETERNQASAIIQQRAAILKTLIQQYPSDALSLAFSDDLLSRLKIAFPDSASLLESVGSWDGSLEYIIEDGRDLKTHREHHRVKIGNTNLNVHFATAAPANLTSGTSLHISGVRLGTEVAADGTAGGSIATGAGAMCSAMGEQRSIVLLVTMPGTPAPIVTPADVHDMFFATTGPSVSDFWRENSFGQTWAQGDVAGWFTLDANYTCDQTNEIRDAAIRAADSAVDFTKYSRIFLVVAGLDGSCGWAGLGTVGCSWLSSTGDGSFAASTSWMLASLFDTRAHGVKLSIHEGGHNLGLNHAASRDFGTEALGAPGTTGTLSEYGDEYSTMGAWTFAHYAAPHKQQLGWLSSDSQTITTSGSFSLKPVEAAGALHALKIRRGTDDNNWIWVEYRKPIGIYDSTSNPLVFDGALIHYEDPTTGARSHALDFTPETDSWSDPVLLPGKSWTDPYTNVSVAVDSAGPDALNLRVAYGPIPCVQASPTLTISPLNPSAYAGDTVPYTLSIKNNDSQSCASRTFNLSSLIPSWTTSFSQSSLVLAPAATSSAIMSKVVPIGTVPATYSVGATVSANSSSSDVSANVTIVPSCISSTPTVTLSPTSANVTAGSTVSIAMSVRNNDSVACGSRTLFLSSVTPSGLTTAFSPTSVTLAPGSASSVTMAVTAAGSTVPGTYNINAIAKDSTSSGSASETMTVQAPASSFTTSISIQGTTFSRNSIVPITAKVLQGSAGVSGASVQFTLAYPNGTSVVKKMTTDSSGQAVWSYRVGAKDPKGTYAVSALGKAGSQSATSPSLTFTVQ